MTPSAPTAAMPCPTTPPSWVALASALLLASGCATTDPYPVADTPLMSELRGAFDQQGAWIDGQVREVIVHHFVGEGDGLAPDDALARREGRDLVDEEEAHGGL